MLFVVEQVSFGHVLDNISPEVSQEINKIYFKIQCLPSSEAQKCSTLTDRSQNGSSAHIYFLENMWTKNTDGGCKQM